MTYDEAKEYIRTSIVRDVYNDGEAASLGEFAGILEQKWVMDFKTVSTEKSFLEAFVCAFEKEVSDIGPFQVCGMESGALPFVTSVSLLVPNCKNAFYVRKSTKKHDLAKTIEGNIVEGLPIVIVDDILNSGSTVMKQIIVLQELGYRVHAAFSVLRFRDHEYYQIVKEQGVQLISLFTLDDFSSDIGVSNIVSSKKDERVNRWEGVWKVKLSRHNPYIVIPKSGITADTLHLYVGGDDGYMRAISKETGETLWKEWITVGTQGKRIFSTPTLSNGKLFFGAYDGNLYCLDALTGKRRWVFMDADWIGSSPCVSEDGTVVYIGLEFGLFKKHGGIAAVDAHSGKLIWSYYDMQAFTHASPAVSQKLNVVVCGSNDAHVYCFERKSGKLKWKYKTGGEVKYGVVFDEKRKLVIVPSMDGTVHMLNVVTGELDQSFSADEGFYSTPAVKGDKVVIGSLDKKVYCYDLSTKNIVWKVETRGRIFSSPSVDKDSIFIGSNDGTLYELHIETGEMVSSIQLPERIVNKSLVETENGNRVVYIPTHACEVYKFKEKER